LALFGRRLPERVVGIVGAGVRKPTQNLTSSWRRPCLLPPSPDIALGNSSPACVAISLGNLMAQIRAGFLRFTLLALPVAFRVMGEDALALLMQ
jgi:hypothetical protein